MTGFAHDIAGGDGTLIIDQLQSENFDLAALSGWAILKSGLAYFFGVILSGGTVTGPDYILDSGGFFLYGGAPGPGNLIAALSNTPGPDQFGNDYEPGLFATEGNVGGYDVATLGEEIAAINAFLSTLHVTEPPPALTYTGSAPGTNGDDAYVAGSSYGVTGTGAEGAIGAGPPASSSNPDLFAWAVAIANWDNSTPGDLNTLAAFTNTLARYVNDSVAYENALGTEVTGLIAVCDALVSVVNQINTQLQAAGIFT